jgi:hypothetical protein
MDQREAEEEKKDKERTEKVGGEHKHFHKRGVQRWTQMLTAAKSRIGHTNGLRQRLGERWWNKFLAYAKQHFRPAYLAPFSKPMTCCGSVSGEPCPRHYHVDPKIKNHLSMMEGLHLDHAIPLSTICSAWKDAIAGRTLRGWDDGIDATILCKLLFGVGPSGNIQWRCGNTKDKRKNRGIDFCHKAHGAQVTRKDLLQKIRKHV